MVRLSSASLILLSGLFSCIINPAAGQGLNVTAIAAVNGSSVFQCWNLAEPPFLAAGAANYPLGNSTNAFVGVLPPRTYIGQAFAPSIQYVLVIAIDTTSGQPRVHEELNDNSLSAFKIGATALSNVTEIYVQGGRHGIIIAADTKNVSHLGHITEFPGDEPTLIAQFPVTGNVVPMHLVLHSGACSAEDFGSLD